MTNDQARHRHPSLARSLPYATTGVPEREKD